MTTVGSIVLAEAAPAAMATRSVVNAPRAVEAGARSVNTLSSSLDNIQGPLAHHADGLHRYEEVEGTAGGCPVPKIGRRYLQVRDLDDAGVPALEQLGVDLCPGPVDDDEVHVPSQLVDAFPGVEGPGDVSP